MGSPEGRGAVELAARIRQSEARFAVTGATGWLGRAAAECLAEALGDSCQERLGLFASRPRQIELDGGATLAVRPLEELEAWSHDVLLHYAFLTRERVAEHGPEAYVRSNLELSARVMRAVTRNRPKAVFYASSGAVYGAGRSLEPDLGANPYGTLKYLDELALRRLTADCGGRSIVFRVFNVAGPWLTKPRAFALSDFIWQARRDGRIVVGARAPVLRSYVDVSDLARLALGAALDPSCGDDLVLDTAGEETIEIGDLARRVAACVGLDPDQVQREWDPAADADRYVGDRRELAALAARLGVEQADLDTQIARTAVAMRDLAEHGGA